MNNVYYLIHRTNYYNDSWTELKPSKIENYEHQFPGVYLSIITKNTIETIKYNCKYILIFSIKLLKQKNFHINIKDYNGFINENNTYFYWDLNKALEIINDTNADLNEIIFHDSISMKYLSMIIYSKNDNYIPETLLLPKNILKTDEKADKSKLPFYCYPLEQNYTGVYRLKLSSIDFYKKMLLATNYNSIDDSLTLNQIIELIKKQIVYLFNNRDKQLFYKFFKN